jgi:hypothetical protein
MQTLLTERQVAAILQISPKTLRNWRTLEKGPAWAKYGRLVRYDCQDVQLWMAPPTIRRSARPITSATTKSEVIGEFHEP